MKKIVYLLILSVLLVSGCANQKSRSFEGGNHDEDGCLVSTGSSWCEAKQKCLQPWLEKCEDEQVNQDEQEPDKLEPIIGGDSDEHGCKGSTGYSWCEAKQKCLRAWEEKCENYVEDYFKKTDDKIGKCLFESENKAKEKTDDKIMFKSRQFFPSINIDEAIKCFDFIENDSKRDSYYALVQFTGIPTMKDRELLTSLGINLAGFVHSNGFFVSFSKAINKEEILKLEEPLQYIGFVQFQDKKNSFFNLEPKDSDEFLTGTKIRFFEGVDYSTIEKILKENGIDSFGFVKSINISIIDATVKQINKLLEENYVQWIEKQAPPPQNFSNF